MKLILSTSKSKDGSMGLSTNLNSPESIVNRTKFFNKLKIAPTQTIRAQLAHGATVKKVNKIPSNDFVSECDALVTNRPNIFLYILSADCFPVFFYDLKVGVIGIAHAGWRGVIKNIVPKTVSSLEKSYGINLGNLKVVIGPGIRKCHFEIKEDVLPNFSKCPQFIVRSKNKIFVDLAGIIKGQLYKAGIRPKNITDKNKCTFHLKQDYFSYRRDHNEPNPRGLGNMLSVIGSKNNE